MRVFLPFVFFVTWLPFTTPITTVTVFELCAKIVELPKLLREALVTINEYEDLVETAENKKEKMLFFKLDSINLRMRQMEQLHGTGEDFNIIVQILRNLPDTIRLELNLNAIRTKQIYIDMYYNRMQRYIMDFEEYENSTFIDFANTVVSDNLNSVPYLIEGVYRQVTRRDFLELFCQYFQPTPESYFCKEKQTLPQLLHNFMNEIIMLNTKSYILIQAAYMIKTVYEKGNFIRQIRYTDEDFQSRTNNLIKIMKPYMAKSSSELWRCDPEKHIKDQTFIEITNFIHGFILNKVNLDQNGWCGFECDVFTYTLGNETNCRKNNWCKNQETCPKIINCHYVDSSMKVCSQRMPKDNRRYEYIEFGSGRTFGKKNSCGTKVSYLETYRTQLIRRCSYCFCLCDEGPKYFSDRYINLLPARSNITDNKVVTGARFVKHNHIIYLQVQEGKLLSHGKIDLETISWVPLTEYFRTDKNNGRDYHTLSWEQRGFDLADILADDGHVVTGVQFTKVGTRLHLEILQTSFNFTTGQLKKNGSHLKQDPDLQLKHPVGKELKLSNPDIPTRLQSVSTELTTNKYVQITHTDFDKDAGQTAVPFFDAQPVESATPVPLQGIGIFHKGRRGYGGFIAPKIFTYNFSQHLEPVFPTNKQEKLRNN